MSASILVATPHAAFGELLRLSLEEQGHYQIRLVKTVTEARASLDRHIFQMMIVDYDLQDEPFVPFTIDAMAKLPGLRVIVIPPDNNPNHPSLGGLIPHGYLTRPFYLPDLIELAGRLLMDTVQPQEPVVGLPEEDTPAWLDDAILLQGYLEKELTTSDAIAALVGHQGKLRANAGRLPLSAAQEMASLLLRYWDREDKTDLMRYIRLSSIKGEYLAYVTEMTGGFVLMMAYEPGVLISQVRPQTRKIAQRLVTTPPIGYTLKTTLVPGSGALALSKNGSPPKPAGEGEAGPQDSQEEGEAFLPPPQSPGDDGLLYELTAQPEGEEVDGLDQEEPELTRFDLSVLLGMVPPPDPQKEEISTTFGGPASTHGWVHETSLWRAETQDIPPTGEIPSFSASGVDTEPSARVNEHFLETAAPELEDTSEFDLLGLEPDIDMLSSTQQNDLSAVFHMNQMEPVSPALSMLNYTCVLIPRLPHHFLTGELADQLAQWVHQFCLAFGWRLEGISVRPDYLQWTVQVTPVVSPGNLVRIIRQRTSATIFETYEHLKDENPSGDFWAAGYLIVSGTLPPSPQLMREYIQQTRKRQGISKP